MGGIQLISKRVPFLFIHISSVSQYTQKNGQKPLQHWTFHTRIHTTWDSKKLKAFYSWILSCKYGPFSNILVLWQKLLLCGFITFSPIPKISEVSNISNTLPIIKTSQVCCVYTQIQFKIVLFVNAVVQKVRHKSQKPPKIFYEILFQFWAKFCSICSITDACFFECWQEQKDNGMKNGEWRVMTDYNVKLCKKDNKNHKLLTFWPLKR